MAYHNIVSRAKLEPVKNVGRKKGVEMSSLAIRIKALGGKIKTGTR